MHPLRRPRPTYDCGGRRQSRNYFILNGIGVTRDVRAWYGCCDGV